MTSERTTHRLQLSLAEISCTQLGGLMGHWINLWLGFLCVFLVVSDFDPSCKQLLPRKLTSLPTHNATAYNTPHSRNGSLSNSLLNIFQLASSLSQARLLLYLGSFSMRALIQAGQQACFALTLYSLPIDPCCVSRTQIQY